MFSPPERLDGAIEVLDELTIAEEEWRRIQRPLAPLRRGVTATWTMMPKMVTVAILRQ